MRPIKDRISEHLRHWKNNSNASAINEHMTTKHPNDQIDPKTLTVSILERCINTVDNLLKEQKHLEQLKPKMNRKHENPFLYNNLR